MNLSNHLFWDIEPQSIDYQKHSQLIISRVLTRGTLNDWQQIKDYYGLERIKNELLTTRYLDKKSLNFCAFYFNIPKENFRCFTLKQSQPQHWNY